MEVLRSLTFPPLEMNSPNNRSPAKSDHSLSFQSNGLDRQRPYRGSPIDCSAMRAKPVKVTRSVQTEQTSSRVSKGHRCSRHSRNNQMKDDDDDEKDQNRPMGSSGDEASATKDTLKMEQPEMTLVSSTEYSHSQKSLIPRPKVRREVTRSAFRQFRRSALSSVSFPKWSRLSKRPSHLVQLMERYLGSLYQPFESVRKQLMQQARDVLLCRFQGNYGVFEEKFLRPITQNLKLLLNEDNDSSRQSNEKLPGWPLCYKGCVIVHLTELAKTFLRAGDFYFVASDISVTVTYLKNQCLCQLILHNAEFSTMMIGMDGFRKYFTNLLEVPRGEEQETMFFDHLLVSVEGGVQRIQIENLAELRNSVELKSREVNLPVQEEIEAASSLQTRHESNSFASASADENVQIQSHQRLAPLASEEEFCSGKDDNKHHQGVGLLLSRHASDALLGYECINERILTAKFHTSVKDLNVICCYAPTEDADEDEKDTFYGQLRDILNFVKKGDITIVLDTEIKLKLPVGVQDESVPKHRIEDDGYHDNLLSQPRLIGQIDQAVIESRVVLLPGSRDICGRSVIFVFIPKLKKFPSVTAVQLARLLLYFQSVPKREVMCQGFTMLIESSDESSQEWGILDEALGIVEVNLPKTINSVLIWRREGKDYRGNQQCSLFSISLLKCQFITKEEQLLKHISRNQLLPEFGGTYNYDHKEWITFRKFLEPLITGCRMTGRHLMRVMHDLRGSRLPSSCLTDEMIQEQKRQILQTFENDQLRYLDKNGNTLLEKLETYQKKSPHNLDYRDAVEKSSSLYEELKNILQKLTKVADKKLGKLQECLQMKIFEEESSQVEARFQVESGTEVSTGSGVVIQFLRAICENTEVLAWLCEAGEETLWKYRIPAETFNALREQEDEFEKFYFLSMRHIERGRDILEESPVLKNDSALELKGMSSNLKNCLEDFTERLEDTREKLEDTARCYYLLDESYDWALQAMQFISNMKLDSVTSLQGLKNVIKRLDGYLEGHSPVSDDVFDEMFVLAKKLKNERLLQQCKTAKTKCQETVELISARQITLDRAKKQFEETMHSYQENKSCHTQIKSQLWRPIISSSPYRTSSQLMPDVNRQVSQFGSQQLFSREPTGSYTSFPSSYYPVNGFPNSHQREDFTLKNISFVESLAKQTTHTLLPIHFTECTIGSAGDHKSVVFSAGSDSSDTKRAFPNICSMSKENSNGNSLYRNSERNLTRRSHSWRICDEALQNANEVVWKQNNVLKHEQMARKLVCTDDSINSSEETESDTFPEESFQWGRINFDFDDTEDSLPVNAHLLSRTSYSDFLELLLEKTGPEGEKMQTKKILMLIMGEMIQTERDYAKSLEYIIENYIPELQKENISQALRGQRNVIFGNIEKIYEFHNCFFLQELEQCEKTPFSVGQCFLKFEPQFYLYALYSKNKPKSDFLMFEYGNEYFKKKQQELGDKMDLASYLLKPIQRMGKYALLLKQLLKECSERDNDYENLKAAEDLVRFQLRHGNDLLAMDALRDCDLNIKEQGRLMRQDEFLVWQGRSRKSLRHVFLFEDLILFSKTRRDHENKGHEIYQYKYSMKTCDIGLTEMIGESPTKFEIWFRKCKVHDTYILQALCPEVKQAWIQDISKLLWKQAVRNRELRQAEMSSMGIGNKPCLDIKPSQDQINDRSISLQQLYKAPRLRNCTGVPSIDNVHKRPHSAISVSSTTSGNSQPVSSSCGASNSFLEPSETNQSIFRSMTQQSQCSAESGFFTDSISGDSHLEAELIRMNSVESHHNIVPEVSTSGSSMNACINTLTK